MLVYLLRHGETACNAEKRYQGTGDAPLSPKGRASLHTADICPEIVYVTPLVRTKQTAELLFPGARQAEIPDLREMNFGVFEGKSYSDLAQDARYRAWVESGCESRCPGGESKQEFASRCCTAFACLMEAALAQRQDALVIVAHGGTQMAVMERYALPHRDYFEWQSPNGGGFVLESAAWRTAHTLNLIRAVCYTDEETV